MKGVFKTKPYRPPEVNYSNNLNDKNKGELPNSKKYRGKNTWTKSQGPERKAKTDFKGWFIDLDGYILDPGRRASDKFSRTMKEMYSYNGATHINSCQPAIITETPDTFPDPYIPTIIPDTGVERPKTNLKMNYLKRRVLTRLSVRNLGRKMSTKHTCTISKTLF